MKTKLKNINLSQVKIVMLVISFLVVLFPPWSGAITRNGVFATLDGGHNFIANGPALMDVDYKKLGLYLILIWVAYLIIKLTKSELSKN